jgi:hypothetical protein
MLKKFLDFPSRCAFCLQSIPTDTLGDSGITHKGMGNPKIAAAGQAYRISKYKHLKEKVLQGQLACRYRREILYVVVLFIGCRQVPRLLPYTSSPHHVSH